MNPQEASPELREYIHLLELAIAAFDKHLHLGDALTLPHAEWSKEAFRSKDICSRLLERVKAMQDRPLTPSPNVAAHMLARLQERGNEGSDLSPGDEPSRWAYKEITRLYKQLELFREMRGAWKDFDEQACARLTAARLATRNTYIQGELY